jgi:hypothetical protein
MSLELLHQWCHTIDTLGPIPVAEAVGQPLDQVRVILIFILLHPLGWVQHYLVHGTYIRHFFNIIVGFMLEIYVYQEAAIHVWILTGVAYLLMVVLPRKVQANAVMAWVLTHLTYTHIQRLGNDNALALEITTVTMLQVCKLSALAFCYQDGCTNPEKLTTRQKEKMVVKLPNVIEMMSYTLFT